MKLQLDKTKYELLKLYSDVCRSVEYLNNQDFHAYHEESIIESIKARLERILNEWGK